MLNPTLDDIQTLQGLPLFRDLTPLQLKGAAALMTFENREEGELLMRTAAPGGTVYFILTGYMKVCTPRSNDSDFILGLRGPGDILGEMSMMDKGDKSATVVTHTDCDLALITPENFWTVLWKFPPVPRNMANQLSQRIRLMGSTANVLAPCDSETRLARQLLLLATEYGRETPDDDLVMLPFALSASDLAGLTAMPLSEISELLRDWVREGTISSASEADSPFVIRDSAALLCIAG